MGFINLLPWRKQQRRSEIRQWLISLLLMISFCLLLILLINAYLNTLLQKQGHENQLLEKQVRLLNQQKIGLAKLIKAQQSLETELDYFRHLHFCQTFMMYFFIELSRLFPEDVYLDQIERKDEKILLAGYALSNNAIPKLMRQIEKSSIIHDVMLLEIKKSITHTGLNNDEGIRFAFRLQLIVKPEKKLIYHAH